VRLQLAGATKLFLCLGPDPGRTVPVFPVPGMPAAGTATPAAVPEFSSSLRAAVPEFQELRAAVPEFSGVFQQPSRGDSYWDIAAGPPLPVFVRVRAAGAPHAQPPPWTPTDVHWGAATDPCACNRDSLFVGCLHSTDLINGATTAS
jgi:hypothetical protein